MGWTILAVLGVTFEEHSANNVVTTSSVHVEVVDRIWPSSVTFIKPQVMVRVQNRQLRF